MQRRKEVRERNSWCTDRCSPLAIEKLLVCICDSNCCLLFFVSLIKPWGLCEMLVVKGSFNFGNVAKLFKMFKVATVMWLRGRCKCKAITDRINERAKSTLRLNLQQKFRSGLIVCKCRRFLSSLLSKLNYRVNWWICERQMWISCWKEHDSARWWNLSSSRVRGRRRATLVAVIRTQFSWRLFAQLVFLYLLYFSSIETLLGCICCVDW